MTGIEGEPGLWKKTRGQWATLLVLLLSVGSGCDAIDPSTLLANLPNETSSNSQEKAADSLAPATRAAQRERSPSDPEMQSIGPSDSQRVYYQFVDDKGRVQFVERLSDVPAAWRDRVGYVAMSQPPPLTPVDARRSWKLSSEETSKILLASAGPSVARAGGRQTTDVILYSADWCGYCTKAKAHLDREGIDYEVRDVDNGGVASELREKTGRGGVPVLDYSGQILRGYSPQQYAEAVEAIQG